MPPMPPIPPMSGMPAPAQRLLRLVSDHGFGGDQQTGDRRRVLQRGAHDLGRVDDAGLHQVLVFAVLGVVTEWSSFCSSSLPATTAPSAPAFSSNLAHRACSAGGRCRRRPSGRHCRLQLVERPVAYSSAVPPPATMPSSTAARVACMASSTRSFFSFTSISVRTTDADHRNTAGQLGQTLLQLLTVVVGGGLLDLCADLRAAAFDVLLLAGTVDDRGLFLGDRRCLGRPSMSR